VAHVAGVLDHALLDILEHGGCLCFEPKDDPEPTGGNIAHLLRALS
jgi:hypothetical protein